MESAGPGIADFGGAGSPFAAKAVGCARPGDGVGGFVTIGAVGGGEIKGGPAGVFLTADRGKIDTGGEGVEVEIELFVIGIFVHAEIVTTGDVWSIFVVNGFARA